MVAKNCFSKFDVFEITVVDLEPAQHRTENKERELRLKSAHHKIIETNDFVLQTTSVNILIQLHRKINTTRTHHFAL